MKKFFSVILAMLVLSLSVLPSFTFSTVHASTLYESFTTPKTMVAGVFAAEKHAQTFLPTITHDIESVKLKMYKIGTPGDITIEIRPTVDDLPYTTVLATGTTNGNTLTTNTAGEWREITLGASYPLIANTLYAIYVSTEATPYPTNVVILCGDSTHSGDEYGGYLLGKGYYKTTETWQFQGADFLFEEWGTEIVTTMPEVETIPADNITYNETFDWFETRLVGNVTDDGNEPCNVGFYYKLASEPNFTSWGSVLGTYQTGEEFECNIEGLTAETMYEFKSYVHNSAGTDNGTVLQFYTGYEDSIPVVITYNYPMVKGSDNVTLYASIGYDGGSNCTAGFQYLCSENVTWLYSANITDLVTNNNFNFNVSGLLPNIEYSFRAYALNDLGFGYGGIGHFTLYTDLTAPIVNTTRSALVTNNSAYVYGKLVNAGGANCWCGFQYRISGSNIWLESSQFLQQQDDFSEFLEDLTGLTPDKTYEYRAFAWHPDIAGPPTKLIGYGSTMIFSTYEDIRTPVVSTDNATYIDDATVRLAGTIITDGGSVCQVWFQYRAIGTTTWIDTARGYGAYTLYEWVQLVFDLDLNTTYEYRALALNSIGTGYGSIKQFKLSTFPSIPPVTPTPTPGISVGDFSVWLKALMASWGMDNLMGHWAFMGIIMLIVAIVFGGFAIAVKDETIRKIIMVILAFIIVAIFGAFVFSGLLGIWAVAILVIIAVGLIIIVGGRLLNTGSVGNG